VLTPAEAAEVERARAGFAQNLLFERMVRVLPPPSEAEVEALRRQRSTLAEIRFVTFANWDRARAWKRRLDTGTPLSALDAAIAREGQAFATADTFRFVAAQEIPDTLANVIWNLRPGQASAIHDFAGQPTIILTRRFQPRPLASSMTEDVTLKADLIRKGYDRIRQDFRLRLAAEGKRTFDEEGLSILLAAHLKVPPRNDVDSVSGLPIVRTSIGLPVVAPADTGHAIGTIRGRTFTIGDYLDYWARVPALGRPEVRERGAVEGAVDRVLLADEILRVAREQGLDKEPSVVEAVDRQREGFELDHYFAEEIQAKVKVTEAALRKYYEKDPKHYDDRASIDTHIIVLDRQSLADSLMTRLRNGASFSELAHEYSMDGATAAEGGRAGTQYRGTQENAGLEDAMFATPVGQIGGPEKTPQGWVIWRVDAATPPVKRDFTQARSMVERDFRTIESDRLLRARLDQLRKEAKVKLYPERITPDLGRGGPWDD
jgi:hypothetical protein